MLTSDQVDLFQAFGFLHLKQAFDAEETAFVQREFDAVIRRSGVDPRTTDQVSADRASVRDLRDWFLTHELIRDIPHKLLGEGFQFEGFGCGIYGSDSPWHADSAVIRWPFRHIKIALYLDPLDGESGALRVIPGTHRDWHWIGDPVWHDVPDYFFGLKNRDVIWQHPPFGLAPEDVPHQALATRPGDVLVFPENLLHCAFGTKFPRRQIAIAFLQLPWREDQVVHLKSRAAVQTEGCYQPRSLLTHPDPRVRAMVTGLQELGFPEGGPDS